MRFSRRRAGNMLLALFFGGAWCTGAHAAERYTFERSAHRGDLTRVELMLEVEGTLKLPADDKVEIAKLKARGNFRYDERILASTADGDSVLRSLRHYDSAAATVKIETGTLEPGLRDPQRLIVASYADGRPLIHCPVGPLTREELDLVDTIGNSLLVSGLLPAEPVAIGESWKHDNALLAALLGLDAISASEANSRLKSVQDGRAKFELTGEIDGAVAGVASHLKVAAKYTYDLAAQRITWLALLVREDRSIGHVAPGLEVVARLQMKVAALEASASVSKALARGLSLDTNPGEALLRFEAPSGRFRFVHDRRWFVTGDAADDVTMRLVDRGDLISQCNIKPLPQVDPKQIATLLKFQEDVQETLGENFGQFVSAVQATDAAGRLHFRLEVAGTASELPIRWFYHYLADPEGRQLVLIFTLEESLIDTFADADRHLVATVKLASPRVNAAQRPTPARR